MAWREPVDYAPGGLLVADQTLVDGGIVDASYYQYAGRRSPENPGRFKVVRAADSDSRAGRSRGQQTVVRGGYGVFFDSSEGREIDGAADVYPYVSRGNYIQSADSPRRSRRRTRCSPASPTPGAATPAANTFLAVSQSPGAEEPVRAAVVARRSAGAVHEHHRSR